MLAPLLFVSGVASCLASGIMGIKEDNDREAQYEADKRAGYNSIVQDRYDYNIARLFEAYDYRAMIEDIKRQYPRMTDFAAEKVIMASIAKKLMEEETNYKYKPSESVKYFYLDQYTKDEYRRI